MAPTNPHLQQTVGAPDKCSLSRIRLSDLSNGLLRKSREWNKTEIPRGSAPANQNGFVGDPGLLGTPEAPRNDKNKGASTARLRGTDVSPLKGLESFYRSIPRAPARGSHKYRRSAAFPETPQDESHLESFPSTLAVSQCMPRPLSDCHPDRGLQPE